MAVFFPEKSEQKYYDLHVQYLINIFKQQKQDVFFQPLEFINDTAFTMLLDDKACVVDFSDHGESVNESDLPIFKYHCKTDKPGIFPLPPISFHNWDIYDRLKEELEYTCNSDTILCNQVQYGNAKERREYIQELLKFKFPGLCDTEISDQETYWRKINNCLCHVFVPGQNNNMLDRGQLQFIAFGCCTISPELPERLPFNQRLVPDVHYIQCDNRYRELEEKINWLKANREQAQTVGRNAKQLFADYLTPAKVIEWMKTCLTCDS